MKINRQNSETQPPVIEVTPDEALEEVAEWRGIPLAVLAKYGVHVDDDETHPIVFPYPNLAGVWYERRRSWINDLRPNKYLSPKGSSPHLYNPLHLGPNASQVWVCEGEFDTLTAIANGLPAVGVSGAGLFNKKWLRLFSTATVIVAFDGDAAGVKASNKLVEWFKEIRTRAFRFETPDGYDLNELYQEEMLDDALVAFTDVEGIKIQRLDED